MAKKQSAPKQKLPTELPVADKSAPSITVPVKKTLSLKWKLAMILAAIAFLLYANTLQNGFVLDDNMVYAKNRIVNEGFAGIPELFTSPRLKGFGYLKNENYRPLSLVMFAVEVGAFGLNPRVGHFFNILFFSACVVAMFFFLDKLFERRRTTLAFIATLLFAVHPIHTEVVANIKSLDEIFCFLFAFIGLNLYADYMKNGKLGFLLGGALSIFLSYLSKETVVTFLAIVPLVFFLYLNDSRQRAIVMTAATALMTGIYLAIRHVILTDYGASTSAVEFIDNALVGAPNIAMRIATALYTLGVYVKLLFIPAPLINDYGYNSVPYVGFGNVWVLLTLVLYVGAGLWATYRLVKVKKDYWAFGVLFYLATISLFSNIAFLMGSAMGERFLFFASAGFCLLAALAVDKWLLKEQEGIDKLISNKVAVGVLGIVTLLFSYQTFARNTEWKDNFTLFKSDLAKSPENCRLNYYLGNELVENVLPTVPPQDTAKRNALINESIGYLNKTIQIYYKYTDAHTELGTAYLNKLNYDSAIAHFKIAINQSPYQSIAANNLGTAYLRQERIPEAVEAYKLAIKIKADFVQALSNLGTCYAKMKQFDSAILYLNQALAYEPNYPDAFMQIGLAYYFAARYAESEPYFKKALELNPGDANAANNLGAAYLNMGRYQDAANIFKQVVAANPGYVNAYSNLGRCYFELKQFPAAIDIILKSLQVDPNNVKDIPYVALSHKAMGNMQEAKRYEAIAKQYFPQFNL